MIKEYDNEILWWKLILSLPHVHAGIIGHFEDEMCETLNLMRLKNPKKSLLTKRPKQDYEWL